METTGQMAGAGWYGQLTSPAEAIGDVPTCPPAQQLLRSRLRPVFLSRALGAQRQRSPAEQINQRVFYTYDVNPLDPGNYTNSRGRLTGVSYQQQNATANQFAYYYS